MYEFDPCQWLWQSGCGKASMGGLSVSVTEERRREQVFKLSDGAQREVWPPAATVRPGSQAQG